jgi:3-oxoacyl-[acyl-carrier-protein] synthase III
MVKGKRKKNLNGVHQKNESKKEENMTVHETNNGSELCVSAIREVLQEAIENGGYSEEDLNHLRELLHNAENNIAYDKDGNEIHQVW